MEPVPFPATIASANRDCMASEERTEPAGLVPGTLPPGYRMQSEDTTPEAEALLVGIWRDAPAWRKAEIASALCRATGELALVGLRSCYPASSREELRLRLAALRLDRETMIRVYGWDPAERGA